MKSIQLNAIIGNPETLRRVQEHNSTMHVPMLFRPQNSLEEFLKALVNGDKSMLDMLITDQASVVRQVSDQNQFVPIIFINSGEHTFRPLAHLIQIDDVSNSIKTVGAISQAATLVRKYDNLRLNSRRLTTLGDQERCIIEWAADGIPNKIIAVRLGISVKTVEKKRKKAYLKLSVSTAAEMASLVTFDKFCSIPSSMY